MKSEYKIKKTILLDFLKDEEAKKEFGDVSIETEEEIDALWNKAGNGWLQDATNEFRHGEEVTGLRTEFDRNYETQAVAGQMFDGSWVGWTFWYGGGKHGQPETIEWISESYPLEMKEQEVTRIEKTFKKIDED